MRAWLPVRSPSSRLVGSDVPVVMRHPGIGSPHLINARYSYTRMSAVQAFPDSDAAISCAAHVATSLMPVCDATDMRSIVRILHSFSVGPMVSRADYSCRQSSHFIGEPLQDSTAFQGENVRDSGIDRITVSFVGGWNLTFRTTRESRWTTTGERSGFPPSGGRILICRSR